MTYSNPGIIFEYQPQIIHAEGKADATLDAALRHIWQFDEFTGQMDFREVTKDIITKYKDWLSGDIEDGRQSRASTIVHTLYDLQAFYKWLPNEPGYETISPNLHMFFTPSKRLVQIANAPTEKTYPEHMDFVRIVEAMPIGTFYERRDRALVAFLYLSGVRVGVLITLKLRHVDLEKKLVFQLPADGVKTKNSKTMRTAWFPVGEFFEQIVIAWINEMVDAGAHPDVPLFPKSPRQVFGQEVQEDWEFISSDDAVVRIMSHAAERVGVERFTPHRVRDTIVSMFDKWTNSFQGLKALSQNLGHVDLRTTFERYGPVSDTYQHDLIAKMRDRRVVEFDYDVLAALSMAPDHVQKTIKDILVGFL